MSFEVEVAGLKEVFGDISVNGIACPVYEAFKSKYVENAKVQSLPDSKRPFIAIRMFGPTQDESRNRCETITLMDATGDTTTVLVIDYPNPIQMLVQVELHSYSVHHEQQMLRGISKAVPGALSLAWSWEIGGFDVEMQCNLYFQSEHSMSDGRENEYYGYYIYSYILETWDFEDAEPYTIPIIQERVARVGDEMNPDEDRLKEVVNFDTRGG